MKRNLRLFRINGNIDDLEKILIVFSQLSCIQPVLADNFTSQVHGLTTLPKDNPWQAVINELDQVEKISGIQIEPQSVFELKDGYDTVGQYVHSIHESFKDLLKQKEESMLLIRKYEDALTQVENINYLDVSIDDIFSCQYINSRFGKMPIESLETLKLYKHKPIIFEQFKESKNICWCMYMTTDGNEREVDNIFSSLFFERIYIPDFVHGTPDEARTSLMNEIAFAKKHLDDILHKIGELVIANKAKLEFVKGELQLINQMDNAKKYVVRMGDKFSISGFIHKNNVEMLKQRFQHIASMVIDIMPATLDKRLTPPKHIRKQ